MKASRLFLLLAVCGLFALLILAQAQVKRAALDSLVLCATALLPSLLPFSVAANLFLLLRLDALLSPLLAAPLRRWLGLPEQAAGPLLLGLLGGYPIGLHALAACYRDGLLRRDEALRLSRICNQAGPSFLVGAAGASLFGSVRTGLLLWSVQLLSFLLTARLFRTPVVPSLRVRRLPRQALPLSFSAALPEAVRRSCQSLLTVCGFVVFFGALLAPLQDLPFLHALPSGCAGLIVGTLELTNGLFLLAQTPPFLRFVFASVLLAWGGCCVQFQGIAALRSAELSVRPCLSGKAVQALLSLPVSWITATLAGFDGCPLPGTDLYALLFLLPPLIFVFFCRNTGKIRKSCYNRGQNEWGGTLYAVSQKRRKVLRLLPPRGKGQRGSNALLQARIRQL